VYFDSLQAALAMGGHGVYVWSVVLVSTLISIGLLVLPALSARRFLARQRGAETSVAPERAAPAVTIEEVNNAPGS
jgi:heme exporter protein CcmD